jgi:hypothetical protein
VTWQDPITDEQVKYWEVQDGLFTFSLTPLREAPWWPDYITGYKCELLEMGDPPVDEAVDDDCPDCPPRICALQNGFFIWNATRQMHMGITQDSTLVWGSYDEMVAQGLVFAGSECGACGDNWAVRANTTSNQREYWYGTGYNPWDASSAAARADGYDLALLATSGQTDLYNSYIEIGKRLSQMWYADGKPANGNWYVLSSQPAAEVTGDVQLIADRSEAVVSFEEETQVLTISGQKPAVRVDVEYHAGETTETMPGSPVTEGIDTDNWTVQLTYEGEQEVDHFHITITYADATIEEIEYNVHGFGLDMANIALLGLIPVFLFLYIFWRRLRRPRTLYRLDPPAGS